MEKVKKFWNKNSKIIFIAAVIVAAVAVPYILIWKPNPVLRINWNRVKGNAAGSVLSIEAPAEVNNAGKNIIVRINLDTQGNIVNAVQSILVFDPGVLEVVNTSTKESFCKFYPENYYDNEKGQVRLACGTPYPGFSGKNTLEVIEFMTKATKTTKLSFSKDSMVLANDGKGTDLLKSYQVFSIKIIPTL